MSQFIKVSLLSAALVLPNLSFSGAFVLAQEDFPDIRMHPRNFSGFGGDLDPIRVCMDISANQAMAVQAEPALIKAIATINRFRSLGANTLALGTLTDVPSGQFDFESVLLHELGHANGLAHPNHADESGLPGAASNGTASGNGPNNVFDQGAGVDGLHGSADDVRGDDQNLQWYGKAVNNPGLLPTIIDESSYARDLSFLPPGHLYAANADRQVLAALGFANAEAVMQQGALADEVQRHFQHDDIATLRFARAGLDDIQGTSDDYRTQLVYRGRSLSPQSGEACQISVRFDTSTGFASSSLGSYRHSTAQPNHYALFSARIRFNPSVNWYFSPGPNTTTTIVSDLPDASVGLAPIIVRVGVAKAAGNPIASHPLGVVEVRDGPRHLASTASCTFTLLGTPNEIGERVLTPLRTGNKTLVADYLGYGGFDGGSDTEAHSSTGTLAFSAISDTRIWAASTGTGSQSVADFSIVRNQPSSARIGQGVHVTVNLDVATYLGPPFPTGMITVSDGVDQCQILLPASSCFWLGSTPGTRNLIASWPGNANFSPRTSAAVVQTVLPLGVPQLISVPIAGAADSNGVSIAAALGLSADGRFVVFSSLATDLVNGDSNAVSDVFIRDQRTGHVRRMSTSASGGQANGASREPAISANGRFVAFTSLASNLVVGDTNNVVDVFVKDLSDGSIVRANLRSNGQEDTASNLCCNGFDLLAPSLSADGRYIAFMTGGQLSPLDTSFHNDIYVRDLQTGMLDIVSSDNNDTLGDFRSMGPAVISADGRYVAFASQAFNFAPNDNNDTQDIWRKDRLTRRLDFVSTNAAGQGGFDTSDVSYGTATPQIATSTVITSHNPDPSARDASYIVAVSVTRSSGGAAVRGTVLVYEGSAFCYASLSGSDASATGQCALTATSVGNKTINARYGGDQQYLASSATAVSHTVLPILPFAPSIGTARPGNGEVLVYFTAPSDNGGVAILGYTASCGARSAIGQGSPITVGGLSNAVAVTCTVVATNAVATDAESAASNSVTPSSSQTAVGPFAYVPRLNTGQMAVIDLGRDRVIAEISGGSGIGIAVAPNGLRAYAIDQASSTVRVINTVSKTMVTSIAVGAGPWSGVVSPNSTRLYVSNRNASTVSVIDTANNSVLSTFNVAAAPTGLVISPDGSKLFVGSANTTSLSVVALPGNIVTQVSVSTTSHALAISPDGSRVYFVNGQQVGRVLGFNTATNTVAGSVNVGGVPLGINISSDGSRVYVSNNGGNNNLNGNSVTQIDAASLTVIATGATGPRPLGVDVHPDGRDAELSAPGPNGRIWLKR